MEEGDERLEVGEPGSWRLEVGVLQTEGWRMLTAESWRLRQKAGETEKERLEACGLTLDV